MKYYFIYSAGGGGGEWDGTKRIWKGSVKKRLKKNILLKFGDIFINHRSSPGLVRPVRWKNISDVRAWIACATGDAYVMDKSNIMLDSGTAKIVSWLAYHFHSLSSDDFIKLFNDEYEDNNMLEKYSQTVLNSNINHTVSIDIPNPFKVRSQGADNRLNLIDKDTAFKFVDITAKYANDLHCIIGDRIMTTINGQWSADELYAFLGKLNYTPKHIAVGGLSTTRKREFADRIEQLNGFKLHDYDKVHFLGCAGLDKIDILKANGYASDSKFSADCSTPINRSFSDRISNYYVYDEGIKIPIEENNYKLIINKHKEAENPYFDVEEMKDILKLVLKHQSDNALHSHDTFNARAKIMLHNSDVFRRWANE